MLLVGIDPAIFHAEVNSTYQAEISLSASPECRQGTYILKLDAGIARRWIEVTVV